MKTNTIYNEPCLSTMAKMPDGFIDLTVTSPPYDNLRSYNNNINESWGEHAWKPVLKELYRVTKDGGVVVWVVGDATINGSETGTSFKQALYAKECGFNLHDTMIYSNNKPPLTHNRYEQAFEYMFVFSKGKPHSFNPITKANRSAGTRRSGNRKCASAKDSSAMRSGNDFFVKKRSIISNIWCYNAGGQDRTKDKIAFNHPAIFPEKLAYSHIISWSNEGDLVYDPFMGSGTTAKMAIKAKRNYIGSEISKEYVDIATKRINDFKSQLRLF